MRDEHGLFSLTQSGSVKTVNPVWFVHLEVNLKNSCGLNFCVQVAVQNKAFCLQESSKQLRIHTLILTSLLTVIPREKHTSGILQSKKKQTKSKQAGQSHKALKG